MINFKIKDPLFLAMTHAFCLRFWRKYEAKPKGQRLLVPSHKVTSSLYALTHRFILAPERGLKLVILSLSKGAKRPAHYASTELSMTPPLLLVL